MQTQIGLSIQVQVPCSVKTDTGCDINAPVITNASRDPRRMKAHGVIMKGVRPPCKIEDSSRMDPFLNGSNYLLPLHL